MAFNGDIFSPLIFEKKLAIRVTALERSKDVRTDLLAENSLTVHVVIIIIVLVCYLFMFTTAK